MISQFTYNEISDIIEVQQKAEINLNTIKAGFQQIRNDHALPRRLKVLIDARQSFLNLQPGNVEEVVNEASFLGNSYQQIKEAIVLSKPRDTALAMLISTANQCFNYRLGVFSTIEAAQCWLSA